MKKYSRVLFLCVFLLFISRAVFGEGLYSLELDNNSVKIISGTLTARSKVIVEKGNERYYYNINNREESIPLQFGNGKYMVKVVEHISGNKYKVIKKSEFDVKSQVVRELYTESNQPVYWKDQDETIKLAKQLNKDIDYDMEKVKVTYNYIIKNISYDHNKISTLADSYVPELDKILKSKSGICYDYASLFAGILRSQGIPAKLVKGYKSDLKEYHAWNEVLIDNKWIVIDTTYDAALKDSKTKVSMIKEKSEYKNLKVY